MLREIMRKIIMPRAFNLVHLTDFHLFQPHGTTWRDFLNKRSLSYLSWRLHRRRKNSRGVLSAVLDFLPTLAWDHVVITGDLTHMGLPREGQLARRYLERIGPAERVLVIPGNHDAMVPSAVKVCHDLWRSYMASDAEYQKGPMFGRDCYPTVRVREGVALIGLSSARPTRPFSAAGWLGSPQLQRLAAILSATGQQHLFRVLLIHHPFFPGQVSPRKGLRDAAALRNVLGRHGAELVLHGHTHHHSHALLSGPAGAIPVIGLPSSTGNRSTGAKSACLRVYTILPRSGGWQIKVHDYRQASRGRMGPAEGPGVLSPWHTQPNIEA
jgi:3',5'-cyclic AMP phosphodiesterase CpdA